MSDPLISVIMPVYNGAETLVWAISSVLGQTFEDYEILFLDDGSTDNSLQVASMFSDSRIRVLTDGVNQGLAYRLNQGIDLARGRYIARMDQDDMCFPERFARQFEFLESRPDVDLLGCRAMVFRSAQDIVGLMPFFGATHEEICASPWNSIRLSHPTWMGRAEWFRKYRYRMPEVILAEDQELLLRAYPESHFACLGEVLFAYRRTHFRLYKTLCQRSSLLKMQFNHFVRRRQWLNAAMSVFTIIVKMSVDIAAALPGCSRLFFRRMGDPIPPSMVEKFRNLKFDGTACTETKTQKQLSFVL
jgi:glycosyltransferase involved in cell wall biosynthesis